MKILILIYGLFILPAFTNAESRGGQLMAKEFTCIRALSQLQKLRVKDMWYGPKLNAIILNRESPDSKDARFHVFTDAEILNCSVVIPTKGGRAGVPDFYKLAIPVNGRIEHFTYNTRGGNMHSDDPAEMEKRSTNSEAREAVCSKVDKDPQLRTEFIGKLSAEIRNTDKVVKRNEELQSNPRFATSLGPEYRVKREQYVNALKICAKVPSLVAVAQRQIKLIENLPATPAVTKSQTPDDQPGLR